jgi:hypothetical protein
LVYLLPGYYGCCTPAAVLCANRKKNLTRTGGHHDWICHRVVCRLGCGHIVRSLVGGVVRVAHNAQYVDTVDALATRGKSVGNPHKITDRQRLRPRLWIDAQRLEIRQFQNIAQRIAQGFAPL